jgi:hypothetical protein
MTMQERLMISILALVLLDAFVTRAPAESLINFNRNDPDIIAFREKYPGGESSVAGKRVPSLALPVLDFTYPAVAGIGGFESAMPETDREELLYDPKDPTNYSMQHSYDDVTIIVTADLNVQTTFDGKTKDFARDEMVVEPARLFDPEQPRMARVTLYKFGIPYTIDIECGPKHIMLCRNSKQLRAIAERLALVSVPKDAAKTPKNSTNAAPKTKIQNKKK